MKKLCAFVLIAFAFDTSASAQQERSVYKTYFTTNSARLNKQSMHIIDSFAIAYKQANSKGTLSIKGYADALGSNAYNFRLSKQRVAAVKAYLGKLGVPKDAISFEKSYGEKEASQQNRSVEMRYLDRRVEILWKNDSRAAALKQDSIVAFSIEKIKEVKAGQLLRLNNLNFEPGTYEFLPQAYVALKELLDAMKANPKLVIEIQGHICCLPSTTYYIGQEPLSPRRAKAVFDYLVDGGIAERRMTYKGFSNSRPLVSPEVTEEDRTANRRVEIKIIAK